MGTDEKDGDTPLTTKNTFCLPTGTDAVLLLYSSLDGYAKMPGSNVCSFDTFLLHFFRDSLEAAANTLSAIPPQVCISPFDALVIY